MDEVFVFLGFFLVPILSSPNTVNVPRPIGKDNLQFGDHRQALGIGRVAACNAKGNTILAVADKRFLVLPVEAPNVFPSGLRFVAPGTFRADFLAKSGQSGRIVLVKVAIIVPTVTIGCPVEFQQKVQVLLQASAPGVSQDAFRIGGQIMKVLPAYVIHFRGGPALRGKSQAQGFQINYLCGFVLGRWILLQPIQAFKGSPRRYFHI